MKGTPRGVAARAMSLAAVLIPFIAVYAHKGLAVVAALAAALCLADPGVRKELGVQRLGGVLILVGLVLAYGGASAFWSVDAWSTIVQCCKLLALSAEAVVLLAAARSLDDGDRSCFERYLIAGVGTLLVALAIENVSNGAIIKPLLYADMRGDDHLPKLNPGNAALLIFAWPAVFAVARRFGGIFGMGAFSFLAAVLFTAYFSAPLAALAVSIPVVVGALLMPRLVAQGMGVAVALWGLATPWIVKWLFAHRDQVLGLWEPGMSPMGHRTLIWNFVVERIVEKPFLGWGLNSSRAIPGGNNDIFSEGVEALPLHPHNGFLQVWLELGAVGAVLATGLAAIVIARTPRACEGGHCVGALIGVLAVFFAIGQVSFSLWSNWWLSATGLAAAFAVAMNSPSRRPSG